MVAILVAEPADTRPYSALGARLASARHRAHLSQREAAALIHISEGYLPQIERGRRRPDPLILRRMADVYGVAYDELAALAGFIDAPEGDVAIIVPPEEAEDIRRFARLPTWARKIGLAAARAADALSPIEQVPNPRRDGTQHGEPAVDGSTREEGGEQQDE